MKYAIVILDGAPDLPCEALGGKTPLQAAHKPAMDALAAAGRVGTFEATAEGATPDSALAARALLGFDAPDAGAPAQPFFERFGVRAAMISAVPALQALGQDLGMETIPAEREDAGALVRRALNALGRNDLVCLHVQSPLAASQQRDVGAKVAAIETIDREIVGVLASELPNLGEWRMLVAATMYHFAASAQADPSPVPFLISGTWVRSVVQRPYTEEAAAQSDLHVERAHDLMEYFLFGGLARVPGSARGSTREGARVRQGTIE